MERDEILAIYAAGPDAMVAFVEELMRSFAAELATLREQVKAQEDRLAVDSHNSHQSPSRDRSRKRRSLRTPSGRKPGGQPGHPGTTLAWCATPDAVQIHRPPTCTACGASLDGMPVVSDARRQVVELPVVRLTTTEHVAEACRCGVCGQVTRAAFPADVAAPVSYGPQLSGWAIYLNQYHLLPAARTARVLADLLGCSFSPGTLTNAVAACHRQLETTETATKEELQAAAVAHFDETGLWVAGRHQWAHVASTATQTDYGIEPRRGQAGMQAVGVLPAFQGVAVHDGLVSYFCFPCTHAFCNVHHLRDLTAIVERQAQPWAAECLTLLPQMKASVARAQEAGRTALRPAVRRWYLGRYRTLVQTGLAVNPPAEKAPNKPGRATRTPGGKLALRFATQPEVVLRFLTDFQVPFDNNQAERDIRMLKLRQKISGGFRTTDGAIQFARIRGYLSTAQKQRRNPLLALQAACAGQPLVLT